MCILCSSSDIKVVYPKVIMKFYIANFIFLNFLVCTKGLPTEVVKPNTTVVTLGSLGNKDVNSKSSTTDLSPIKKVVGSTSISSQEAKGVIVGSGGNVLEKDDEKSKRVDEVALLEKSSPSDAKPDINEVTAPSGTHKLIPFSTNENVRKESLFCPGVICSHPSSDQQGPYHCKESWTTTINPALPVIGSKLDCCPVHICVRSDGSEFTHYGIESSTLSERDASRFYPKIQDPDAARMMSIYSEQQNMQHQQRPAFFSVPQLQGSYPYPQGVMQLPPMSPMVIKMNNPQLPRYNRNAEPFVHGGGEGGWGPWVGADPSLFFNPRFRRDLLQSQWRPGVSYGGNIPMQAFPTF